MCRDIETLKFEDHKKMCRDIIEFTTDNQHHAAQATTGRPESTSTYFGSKNVQLVQLRNLRDTCRSRGCCGYSSASGIRTQQNFNVMNVEKEAMDADERCCRKFGHLESTCIEIYVQNWRK
jgi:hypothetical protein